MRQWHVSWDETSAVHNYKHFQDKFEGDVEIWKITLERPGSTWRAYVVKLSTFPITDCRDPHFSDLLDNPANYRQVTPEELT